MAVALPTHLCIHSQAGDLIRDEIKSRTPLGISVEEKIAAGQLLDDEVVLDLLAKRIAQADVAKTGAVLDGFPRSIAQAERLEELSEVELVVNLAMREDALVAKLLGRCALLLPASLMIPLATQLCPSQSRHLWRQSLVPKPAPPGAFCCVADGSDGSAHHRHRCTCANCGRSYNTASVNLGPDTHRMLPPVILKPLAPPGGRCESCGCPRMARRADDTPETIAARLRAHWRQCSPVENHYREGDRTRVVDFEIVAGIPETLPNLLRAICATGRVTVGAGEQALRVGHYNR